MATIREMAEEFVRDTEDGRFEWRDGVEGIHFFENVHSEKGDFIPLSDLGYNSDIGFFSRSRFPNEESTAEPEPDTPESAPPALAELLSEEQTWQLFKQLMERRADYRQIAADAVKLILGDDNDPLLLSPELTATIRSIRYSVGTIVKSYINLTDRVARLESALEEAGQPLPEREPVNLDDVGIVYPPLRLDALIASVNAGPLWKSAAEPPPPEMQGGPFWVWPLHASRPIRRAGGRPARYDAETGYWIDPSDGIAFDVTHYVALPQTPPAAS